jgi:putative FmdB family regulatory protein
MPLYEYHCTKCGHQYEKIQKFSDLEDTACPKCGGPVERPISAPAVQFKGSGWYVTDYAGKGKSSAKSDSDSKPESKPEAKSETKATEPKKTD